MAHIFERVVQGVVIHYGGGIGFFQGDIQKLFEDIAVLKPTLLPGVPRLFSRVFDKVMQGKDNKGGIAKFLFDLGYVLVITTPRSYTYKRFLTLFSSQLRRIWLENRVRNRLYVNFFEFSWKLC